MAGCAAAWLLRCRFWLLDGWKRHTSCRHGAGHSISKFNAVPNHAVSYAQAQLAKRREGEEVRCCSAPVYLIEV